MRRAVPYFGLALVLNLSQGASAQTLRPADCIAHATPTNLAESLVVAAPVTDRILRAIPEARVAALERACKLPPSPASDLVVNSTLRADALLTWAVRGFRKINPVDEAVLNSGWLGMTVDTRRELATGLLSTPSDAAITEFTAWAKALKIETGPARSMLLLYASARGTIENTNDGLAPPPLPKPRLSPTAPGSAPT